MFKRVIYQDWASVVPIISFIATAAVFLVATVRALLMPKSRCSELSKLPLDDPPI